MGLTLCLDVGKLGWNWLSGISNPLSNVWSGYRIIGWKSKKIPRPPSCTCDVPAQVSEVCRSESLERSHARVTLRLRDPSRPERRETSLDREAPSPAAPAVQRPAAAGERDKAPSLPSSLPSRPPLPLPDLRGGWGLDCRCPS
jgi:hypothetical protein